MERDSSREPAVVIDVHDRDGRSRDRKPFGRPAGDIDHPCTVKSRLGRIAFKRAAIAGSVCSGGVAHQPAIRHRGSCSESECPNPSPRGRWGALLVERSSHLDADLGLPAHPFSAWNFVTIAFDPARCKRARVRERRAADRHEVHLSLGGRRARPHARRHRRWGC